MMKIMGIRDFYSLKIYINDLLHLEITMENHDGVQAWHEGQKNRTYYVEFYRKQGNPILLIYDNLEKWKTILNIIDEKL